MTGNQKLVVFNLAIIFPIFVLTIIFPIFVLAAPRDGSSPDLDIMEDLGARAADISIFMDDDEIEEESILGTPLQIDDQGRPIDPTTGLIHPEFQDPKVSLKIIVSCPTQFVIHLATLSKSPYILTNFSKKIQNDKLVKFTKFVKTSLQMAENTFNLTIFL